MRTHGKGGYQDAVEKAKKKRTPSVKTAEAPPSVACDHDPLTSQQFVRAPFQIHVVRND
jgi:hypothetical protein